MKKLNMEVDPKVWANFSAKKVVSIFLAVMSVLACILLLGEVVGYKKSDYLGIILGIALSAIFLYFEGIENLITKAREK